MGSSKLHPPWKTLQGLSAIYLCVKGQCTAKLKNSDSEVKQELFAVKDIHRCLLRRPAIEALGFAVRLRAVQKTKSPQLPTTQTFSSVWKLDQEYLREAVCLDSCRVAIPFMQPEEDLERIEKLGVISQVSEPRVVCRNGSGP